MATAGFALLAAAGTLFFIAVLTAVASRSASCAPRARCLAGTTTALAVVGTLASAGGLTTGILFFGSANAWPAPGLSVAAAALASGCAATVTSFLAQRGGGAGGKAPLTAVVVVENKAAQAIAAKNAATTAAPAAAAAAPVIAAAPASEGLPAGWARVVEDDVVFYENLATGVTQWERPT